MYRDNFCVSVGVVGAILGIILTAGCAHVSRRVNNGETLLSVTVNDDEEAGGLDLSYIGWCRNHVCVEVHGEGAMYLVNGDPMPTAEVWVVKKGEMVLQLANPAMPESQWATIRPLAPGPWRLTVAITATAPLQSYAQLERYDPWKGWVWDHAMIFVNQGRVILPNKAPEGAQVQ